VPTQLEDSYEKRETFPASYVWLCVVPLLSQHFSEFLHQSTNWHVGIHKVAEVPLLAIS